MSGPLGQPRHDLEAALARRTAVERQLDGVWSDDARRAVQQRILTPLDREVAAVRAGLDHLDDELGLSLRTLGD